MIDYTIRTQDHRERWRDRRFMKRLSRWPDPVIEVQYQHILLWRRILHSMGVR